MDDFVRDSHIPFDTYILYAFLKTFKSGISLFCIDFHYFNQYLMLLIIAIQ